MTGDGGKSEAGGRAGLSRLARRRLAAGRPSTPHRRLEAPHRRRSGAPRVVERAGLAGYLATEWVIQHLPPALSRFAIARASQGSYLLWPQRRRWSNGNFARILGVPGSDRRVRALALSAYSTYARYLVELMRLPSLPADRIADLVEAAGIDRLISIWRESGHGLIIAAGHVGNNEAVAAGLAGFGLPVAAVADDSTFPEIFEHLRRQRAAWNITLVPWRNLRDVYGVLRRGEILALLIDWGYRDEDVPVRMFGAWTTLPAGPAVLAARSGAPIVHIGVRRLPGGRFRATPGEVIHVPSASPADILAATQSIADQLAATIEAAPAQWYSFKPMWPATEAEAADLEARAAAMRANRPDPGPSHRSSASRTSGDARTNRAAPEPAPGGDTDGQPGAASEPTV